MMSVQPQNPRDVFRVFCRSVTAFGTGLALFAGVSHPAFAAPLASHRAVYDLHFGQSASEKGPASARGRIVFETRGDACVGYSIKFRQITEVTPSEGSPRSADVSSSTFENAAGTVLQYKIETKANDVSTGITEGKAETSPGGVSIGLLKPSPKKIDLGLNVTFPVQQTIKTLAAAQKGERVLELKTYDGSDGGDKVYHTLQIISAPLTKPAADLTAKIPAMKTMKRWRVVASNFDLKNTDAPPLYVLKFEMWENGISSNVSIDYGTFTLIGTMSKLDVFPAKPCNKP